MTATQPKPENAAKGKVYRAKVTGRHAITLPAELCRQLGIEVGDSIEIEVRGDTVELRRPPTVDIVPISELRGIMRGVFKDWDDIQQYVKELRDEWDDHPELENCSQMEERPAS